MRTIWKFPLEITDYQEIQMPAGGHPISVGVQDETLCLWHGVVTDAPLVRKPFAIVGTGNPMPDDLRDFIGTVQMWPLVWHVFTCDRR